MSEGQSLANDVPIPTDMEYQQNPSYQMSPLVPPRQQVELQYEVLEPLAYETPLNTESARNTIVEYEDTLPPPRTKSCDKEGVASGKGEWFMGGACRRACVALVVLVLCVMLVAALAAGVLALTIIFTGFIDICKCDTTNDIAEFELRVQELEMMQIELQELVQELQNSQTPAPTPDDTTEATPIITIPPVTTPELVTTPTTSLLEGVATLTDVNLFQNCSTSVEVTCTVSPGDSTGFCFTDPLVPINRPGEIILNMNCLRTMETDEINPLIATLEILNGEAGCLCAVPDLDAVGRRLHDVECGLQVTRCITPQNITVPITN